LFIGTDAVKIINDIQPVIDTVYKIEDTKKAFKRIEKGDMVGKIVISI